MIHSDYLLRGIILESNIRFAFTDATGTATFGIVAHDTDPLAAELFAGALLTGALVSPLLNDSERYSFRWEYSGKLKHIIVDVNADCDIRGLIAPPHLMNETASEQDIWGNEEGFVSVIKSKDGAILNSGKTRTAFNDPAADAGFFFSVSDQLETEFAIAIEFDSEPQFPVKIAAGFMLQAMPGCNLETFDAYRKKIVSDEFAALLMAKLPSEKKLWQLITAITGNTDKNQISYTYGNSPGFRCNCSQEKMKRAMSVLDQDDLKSLFKENANPGIVCNFCRKQYRFTAGDFGLTF
jgi:molecular chaperone Hsp33